MKVLLVGATFNSNFGDLLFSHLFYDKCKEVGFERVSFWQWPKHVLCDFCRNELDYHEHISFWKAIKYDVMIMQSGGMFADAVGSFKGTYKRLLRYFLPALIFTLLHKPVYIIGVGGGRPLYTRLMRWIVRYVLNRAKRITVRDAETCQYFRSIGVTRSIEITSDTAQVITNENLPPFEDFSQLDKYLSDRKALLFHLHFPKKGDRQMTIILPAIREFIKKHPEYALMVATDKEEWVHKTYEYIKGEKDCYVYNYNNSWQLAAFINKASVVITLGLHVGIVASSLGKSVLSFPHHYEKTHRYYNQIGESGRCIELGKITHSIVVEQLEKYYARPIVISPKIRALAKANLDIIGEIR